MKIISTPRFVGSIDPKDSELCTFLNLIEQEYGQSFYEEKNGYPIMENLKYMANLALDKNLIWRRMQNLKQKIFKLLHLKSGDFRYMCEYVSEKDVEDKSSSKEADGEWFLPDRTNSSTRKIICNFGDVENFVVVEGIIDVPFPKVRYIDRRDSEFIQQQTFLAIQQAIQEGQAVRKVVPSGSFCEITQSIHRPNLSRRAGYNHMVWIT